MAELYYTLIINGRRTLEQVPASLRDAVSALIAARQ